MAEVLIIQTAFAGDLILTTPLIAATAQVIPEARIDVLCIPATAPLLAGNPAIRDVIVYDKRARKPGLRRMARRLAETGYDIVLSPHRSLRSTLLARATRAAQRIGFDRAGASWMYTHRVPYREHVHEVERDVDLLAPLVDERPASPGVALYPSDADRQEARALVHAAGGRPLLAIAPGSVWATKRWTVEGFIEVGRAFSSSHVIVLIGGPQDTGICARIASSLPAAAVIDTSGRCSFLASAALIAEADCLVSNDSAPVHVASAMNTPVVEIYGATSPSFGFTPYGVPHRIVQREDLACKPCAIHGGERCPEKTFACMRELSAASVTEAVQSLLSGVDDRSPGFD